MRGISKKIVGAAISAVAVVGLSGGRASANTIDLTYEGVSGSGPFYTYTYDVSLDSNSQLDASGTYTAGSAGADASGDGVTLYDVGGYVVGSASFSPDTPDFGSGDSLSLSESLLGGFGTDPSGENDNASDMNISLAYVQGAGDPYTTNDPPGSLDLGTLTLESISGPLSVVPNLQVGSDDDIYGASSPGALYEDSSNYTSGPGPPAPFGLPAPLSVLGGGALLLGLVTIKFRGANQKELAL